MIRKIFTLLFISTLFFPFILNGQVPLPIQQLLNASYMKGASFSFIAKDIANGKVLYSYDPDRELIPASVMKLVTTAAALELLGDDYRFATTLEYDGEIKAGVLNGHLYIRGSGDPTLGSSHFVPERSSYMQNAFIREWISIIQKAGIKEINGSIIADETVFDTEGLSPKWVREDLGSSYGAGSYGLNVFDNLVEIHLTTGKAGSRPVVKKWVPEIASLRFHNYLQTASVPTDSSFVVGAPFSPERFLYGAVSPNQDPYLLKGDIPDPALFLAEYLSTGLKEVGIKIKGGCTTSRIEREKGKPLSTKRKTLYTTYSPPLKAIVRITNERSHNLYADALLKKLGLQYTPKPGEVISSFGRGIKVVNQHWTDKKMDTASLWMYDGSGLAVTDKVSAAFIGELLTYMGTQSSASAAYKASFPLVGQEGSVRLFLKGSALEGRAYLKSGGMSRVRCYAGYIQKEGKEYAIALLTNNYSCEGRVLVNALEKMLLDLF
ncbi:D-alanyl-D-alanine carboxypeptidase/D-alanyl-D-alanine-endopeptidase [Parabacteroides sp. PF5-9]|uniref:D-alanyl-D-alanine carboxypeptidase/D-alanyl-D-alanine endopeptidase n=1 Tax=Parabacteroides sp. PF5-9 TaxID=1742404 RepID=UPI002473D164|nr:D-alanyl-D-alanine carboxypeptidase/D-alanyl-D-alanine-endopeptidase [Parabacteroides sp. PF5-9]MDH6358820.1 D-alanyl-D-alanine carboxypeptidase/D-alanyl-D-alanine-endopeptidase (penicillin-binding protein 4) [Parabacteroides sp. PF5-9]